MAKDRLDDWSTTAASNTDIASIDINEGCLPSGINNAIRTEMAQTVNYLQTVTTIASAGTTNIGASATRQVSITGTTTITAFGTVTAGVVRDVQFTGALTLTHNGASLILPGAANISTAAGDILQAVSLGSGNWRVTMYEAASGAGLPLTTTNRAIAIFSGTNGRLQNGLATEGAGGSISIPSGQSFANAAGTAGMLVGSGAGAGIQIVAGGDGILVQNTVAPGSIIQIAAGDGLLLQGQTTTLQSLAGDIQIGAPAANSVLLTNGRLTFPATQNPSANANTLDDYEEGSFTPAFSATGATFSYATRTASYVKIGQLVFWKAIISLNTSGNTLTANALTMTGLPFTSAAGPERAYVGVNWFQSTTAYVNVEGEIPGSTTAVNLYGLTAATTSSVSLSTPANGLLHPTNGTAIVLSGTYQASA